MTPAQRRRKQVDALVLLLTCLPDSMLAEILERLEVRGAVAVERKANPDRRCNVCGWNYPECRRRAQVTGDDHEYEARS